jgi:hypothetical protein
MELAALFSRLRKLRFDRAICHLLVTGFVVIHAIRTRRIRPIARRTRTGLPSPLCGRPAQRCATRQGPSDQIQDAIAGVDK